MSLPLNILDQSPIAEGSSGPEALQNTLDLARLADELGYGRYWVSEHHGLSLAGPSPEVLIGPIAAATERIRVGSGGVMLPHYSPFKVAENFSLLAGLYPDRVDLGIGRASGTDQLTTLALQRDRRRHSPDDFPAQLAELLAHIEGDMPADHPFARLGGRRLPGGDERPGVWLLGSSPQSGSWAAELGLSYAFADFINPNGADIAVRYRERFEPSARLEAPHVAVAVWAVCADTHEEAERLASSGAMSIALLRQGRLAPVPPPDKALRFLAENPGMALPPRARRTIVGTPSEVQSGIDAVAEAYAADEVIIVTITHDHDARRRSYELLAEAFALQTAGTSGVAALSA